MLGCGVFFCSFRPLNGLAPTSFVAVSGAKGLVTKAGVSVCAARSVEQPLLDFSLSQKSLPVNYVFFVHSLSDINTFH